MNNKISNKLPKEKLSLLAQIKFLFNFFQARPAIKSENGNAFMKQKIAFSLGLVLIAFIVLGAYAYASTSVTAHDSLFVLKRAGENIKVALTKGKNKVEAYTDIAERRLEEIKYLTSGEDDLAFKFINTVYASDDETLTDEEQEIVDTVEMMEEATENSMNAIEEIEDEEEAEEAVELVEELQNEEEEVLEGILEDRKERKEWFKERIAIMKENIWGNREAIREARESIKNFRMGNEGKFKLAIRTLSEEEKELKEEQIREKIEIMKEEAETWKEKVTENVEDPEKLEYLFAKIDGRIEKIEIAIEEERYMQVLGLLKSVHAFKNNARHFVNCEEIEGDVKKAVAEFKGNREEIMEEFKQRKEEIMEEWKEKFGDFKEMTPEEKEVFKEKMMERKREIAGEREGFKEKRIEGRVEFKEKLLEIKNNTDDDEEEED